MATVLHPAPKISEIDGVAEAIGEALGDMLFHTVQKHC